MAGINDCPNIISKLVHELLKIRVRPYYLYQCDLSQGIGHFRTPVSVGLHIIESLRGHTTGFAVPTYVIDAPGGGGKVPLMPQYLISQSEHKAVVRNYEGMISTYTQPKSYASHDATTCQYCRAARPREGVAKLLGGEALTLEPADLARRQRKAQDQRLAIPLIPPSIRIAEPVSVTRETRPSEPRQARSPKGNGSRRGGNGSKRRTAL
jgi:lysine 2,3-aminomutase